MFTASAGRTLALDVPTVTNVAELAASGISWSTTRAQVRAHRWQRIGRAVVTHNAALTDAEKRRAALVQLGPRAALTSFTALEEWGLTGWARDAVHVLVPRGARVIRPGGIGVKVHYCGTWRPETLHLRRRLHRPGPAAVIAASSFQSPRPACGLLAAVVQQRLITAPALLTAVTEAPRTRHRAALLQAVHDIGQGAHALSEIDFARLCRRNGLPEPTRQAVRTDRFGRRRYLDAEWRCPDGRRVVAEVDGALHLLASRWWDDQIRQNELAIAGDVVLRFPSVVVRHEQRLVADQLWRALRAPRGNARAA